MPERAAFAAGVLALTIGGSARLIGAFLPPAAPPGRLPQRTTVAGRPAGKNGHGTCTSAGPSLWSRPATLRQQCTWSVQGRGSTSRTSEDLVMSAVSAKGQLGEDQQEGQGRESRRWFRGLQADRFQHPFDQEATATLRRLPGLEMTVRSLVPVVEEAVYMDNIANSILVGPNQMASLYRLLVEACRILDIGVPDLYIRQNPLPNAYTLAIRGKKPFIVMHTSLVDLMEPKELQAVIAHELGHLKCEHGIWVTVANVLANGLYSGGGLGAFIADRLGIKRRLLQWSRAAEFTCDRAALLVAQNVNVVVSTLLKLAGGSVTQASELSVEEFLKQATAYDVASRTRLGRFVRDSQSEGLTHPLPVIRAQELAKWAKSPHYLGIVSRGLRLDPGPAPTPSGAP